MVPTGLQGQRELQKSTCHATVWASGPFQPVPEEEGAAVRGEAVHYRREEEKSKGRTGVLSFLLHAWGN